MTKRSVFVTGSAGMIGRRVVPELSNAGHVVLGSQLEASIAPDVAVGDLLDDATLQDCTRRIEAAGIDTIVHLAGAASADAVRNNPLLGVSLNVELTARVLNMAATAGVKRFVLASTGLVYGATSTERIDETWDPRPKSLYAATKLAAEALVQGFAHERGIESWILRMSNVYGPDSPPTTVVGKVLADLRENRVVQVRSTRPIRDFVFVDDVARAFRMFAETNPPRAFEVVNVSSGVGSSVAEIVRLASAAAGVAAPQMDDDDPKDQMVLSPERASRMVGWTLRTSFEAGLRESLGLGISAQERR